MNRHPALTSPARRRASLLALPLVALSLAACGNEVPPDSVAKVDDKVIQKTEFDRWLTAAARGQQQQLPGTTQVSAPDPPGFEKCVAAKRKTPLPEGAPKPSAAELKKLCRQEYDALKGQVMQFLVSADWIELEAEERGIKVSDAIVRKQFEEQKKQSFPDEKSYREFLKTSGQTEKDLLFRVRLDYLSNEIRKKIVAGKGQVTDADIKAYYDRNKARFTQPERRDLSVVLTKTRSRAEQAKQQLEDGEGFSKVARRYSIDDASKEQGGKLPALAKGQQEKALDDAVFAAKRGELEGPIKTQFGYYVFEVGKVTPATTQTVEQSKETIRSLIRSEREQKALDAFVKRFRTKYKEQTNCAEGYQVAECKNAPEQDKAKDEKKVQ